MLNDLSFTNDSSELKVEGSLVYMELKHADNVYKSTIADLLGTWNLMVIFGSFNSLWYFWNNSGFGCLFGP